MKKYLVVAGILCANFFSLSAIQADPSTPQHMQPHQNRTGTWYDQKIINRGVIYFYDNSRPYYSFTNFFELPKSAHIDGYTWHTTEQYYQAGKFTDKSLRNLIRKGSDHKWHEKKPAHKSWGSWAFYIANESSEVKQKAKVRSDWFEYLPTLGMQRNINRMLVALRAKFGQNPDLAQQLLATYPKILVEDSYKDGYFGAGNPNGKTQVTQGHGQNLLGRMLMHVRKELYRKKKNIPNPERPFEMNEFSLDYLLNGGQI